MYDFLMIQMPPDIDSAAVKRNLRQHVSVLCEEIGERGIHTHANLVRAERYVISALEQAGCNVERQAFQFGGQEFANLVGLLPNAAPNQQYIIGAHYDTAPGTPGADDNASAVAILLEVARLSANFDIGRNWRFIGFTTEEPPSFHTRRQGSRVYARAAARAGDRIEGVLALEMLGYFLNSRGSQSLPFPLQLFGYSRTGNFVAAVGNWRSRRWTRQIVMSMRRNPALPVECAIVPERGFLLFAVRLSDHSSFWDQGYPAVMLTDTAFYRNPNYHSNADTIDTLNFEAMAEVVKSLLCCIADTDDRAE